MATNDCMSDWAAEVILTRIRRDIEQRITDKLVEDFKAKAKDIVKEALEPLTIDTLQTFRDCARLSDSYHVSVDWRDDG